MQVRGPESGLLGAPPGAVAHDEGHFRLHLCGLIQMQITNSTEIDTRAAAYQRPGPAP
jgi:hypothetical protein